MPKHEVISNACAKLQQEVGRVQASREGRAGWDRLEMSQGNWQHPRPSPKQFCPSELLFAVEQQLIPKKSDTALEYSTCIMNYTILLNPGNDII